MNINTLVLIVFFLYIAVILFFLCIFFRLSFFHGPTATCIYSSAKGGLPWGDVVSWYCNQHQQELTSEEDLSNMQKLVNQVR